MKPSFDHSFEVPRYCPTVPLPDCTYVPGAGMKARQKAAASLADIARRYPCLHDEPSVAYRFGVDLYHHGYLWESHELWEGLWHAEERSGPLADLYQSLILNSAAQLKRIEQRPRGVRNLSRDAHRLLTGLRDHTALCATPIAPLVDEMKRHYLPIWDDPEADLTALRPPAPRIALEDDSVTSR